MYPYLVNVAYRPVVNATYEPVGQRVAKGLCLKLAELFPAHKEDGEKFQCDTEWALSLAVDQEIGPFDLTVVSSPELQNFLAASDSKSSAIDEYTVKLSFPVYRTRFLEWHGWGHTGGMLYVCAYSTHVPDTRRGSLWLARTMAKEYLSLCNQHDDFCLYLTDMALLEG